MSNADVEIRLRLNNEASSGVKKAEQDAQKGAEKTASATERAASRAAAAAQRGADMQRASYQRMAQAREQLGIRPERTIQREIQRTEAAYNRLARSGTASWREQARAAEQMRQRVTQLTNEMGRLTTAQKAVGALKAGASVAAGTVAAGMVLKSPIQKAMSVDERIAYIANDAFQERDKLGRTRGIEEITAAINAAVRKGGGTQDSAIDAIRELLSSNLMSVGDAFKMLPELTKAATASGTDLNELTKTILAAIRTNFVTADDVPKLLNQTVAVGHAGGFTLDRMLPFLQSQMALAKDSGMSGRADYVSLAALNQAALRTSGNEEEAGQSVRWILALMNDKSVADQIKRTTGVNLQKHLQSQRDKGVNSIDAFGGLLQRQVEKNRNYKVLQAKLASAKTEDERTAALEGMAAIVQRSTLGNIITNRKAIPALLAMMNKQGYMQDVRRQGMENDVASGGAVDKDLDVISSRAGFRVRRAGEEKAMAEQAALGDLNEKIGEMAEAFSKVAGEHSSLVGATTLATTALTAFAGAAGVATFAMGGKSIIGAVASRASAGIGARGIGAGIAGVGKGALKMAGKGGLVAVGSMAGGYVLEKTFGEESAVTRYGSAALNGAGIGATIGSIIPGVGTAIGAAAGAGIGLIAQGLSDWFSSDDAKDVAPQQQEQQPVEIDAQLKIGLAPGLVLQSQSMSATGGNIRMNTGNIYTGAPP